jgi:hypothetical protein
MFLMISTYPEWWARDGFKFYRKSSFSLLNHITWFISDFLFLLSFVSHQFSSTKLTQFPLFAHLFFAFSPPSSIYSFKNTLICFHFNVNSSSLPCIKLYWVISFFYLLRISSFLTFNILRSVICLWKPIYE